MALLWGRARLGALTLAYPHTPPFLSWGRFEECAHTVSTFAQRQGQPRLCCTAAAHGVQYSTVEFIGYTSAAPFTLAQLKEFTLARGFKPSLHGATTLPVPSHPSGGG